MEHPDHLLGALIDQFEPQNPRFPGELLQQAEHGTEKERRPVADAKHAQIALLRVPDFVYEFFHEEQELSASPEDLFPSGVQLHSAAGPVDQLAAELVLQSRQLKAKGALGDADSLRRPTKVLFFGESDKASNETPIEERLIDKHDRSFMIIHKSCVILRRRLGCYEANMDPSFGCSIDCGLCQRPRAFEY